MFGVESPSNTDWTAIVIALSAIVGLIITVILHLLSSKEDRKLQFIKLIEKLQSDFSDVNNRLTRSITIEENLRTLRDFLHVLQRLAYLRKLNKIDDNVMVLFSSYFSTGASLLNLLDMIHRDDSNKVIFPYVLWWIKQNNIKAKHPQTFPPHLFEMYQKANSGMQLTYSNNKFEFFQSSPFENRDKLIPYETNEQSSTWKDSRGQVYPN